MVLGSFGLLTQARYKIEHTLVKYRGIKELYAYALGTYDLLDLRVVCGFEVVIPSNVWDAAIGVRRRLKRKTNSCK